MITLQDHFKKLIFFFSRWNTYFEASAFIPLLIQNIFWGYYSDNYGRKALLWIPPILSIYYFLALMAWIYFSLPLEFIFAFSWQKLNGSLGIIMSGAYAMLTDSVEPEDLARRFLYTKLLYRMALALAGIVSGYIVDALGK